MYKDSALNEKRDHLTRNVFTAIMIIPAAIIVLASVLAPIQAIVLNALHQIAR